MNYKHGYSKTDIYITWQGMMNRCYNHKNAKYHRYGARGIRVCDDWHNVQNFVKDMGSKPKNKSIERINNNGDYCKENCRWATNREQANNRSTNKFISYNGITLTVGQWAYKNLLPCHVLTGRLAKGWSFEKAINTPISNPQKTYYTYNGHTKRLHEWSKIFGTSGRTIVKRINRGWSIEDALTKPSARITKKNK